MTTRLPVVLESLRIATPCNADWDEMAGDERVRFCGQCEKNVYNLSAMSRHEAEALVRQREGRLCVRMYQRSDGTVLTQDCPVGVRRARLRERVRQQLAKVTASAALLLGLVTGKARADLTVSDGKQGSTAASTTRAMGHTATPPKMGKVGVPIAGQLVAPVPPKETPNDLRMGDVAVAPPQPTMGTPVARVVEERPRAMMGEPMEVEPAPKGPKTPPAPKGPKTPTAPPAATVRAVKK